MNPLLRDLRPYPFERLAKLLDGCEPEGNLEPILMTMGEPTHPAPPIVERSMARAMPLMGKYPPTKGPGFLREAIADWIRRRHGLELDPERNILPALGTREALFCVAQVVLGGEAGKGAQGGEGGAPLAACPNPFYQIYEGAAIMAGAQPVFLNLRPPSFLPDFDELEPKTWRRVKLVYVCSPGNPAGGVLPLPMWKKLFDLQSEHGFAIVSDECYGEIYIDKNAPCGMFDACREFGADLTGKIAVNSLSKRSNVPGLRSGFVAGCGQIVASMLKYRTYSGAAMSLPVARVSADLWADEKHVEENRELYKEKFKRSYYALKGDFDVRLPQAGFYYWMKAPGGLTGEEFARRLWVRRAVKVLPGAFMARESGGANPGARRARVALTASLGQIEEACRRLVDFARFDLGN